MSFRFERIGIVRLGAIGDTVNVLPFVNRLRRGAPAARITWVIGTRAWPLMRGHVAVDEFLVFDAARPSTWPGFLRELRARRFDLAIDLQRIAKSGLIAFASGAPVRLGFDRARCKEASWAFANRHIAPNPAPGVTVEQYLEFAEWLALPPAPLEWRVPHAAQPGPAAGETRVVLSLGASRPAKLWYAEHWARLAQRIARELGASVHLVGGPGDRTVADEVVARSGVAIVDHVGRTSLSETAGWIAGAHLLVGCDSGPLHLAAGLGVPCVALFGATNPRRSAPLVARRAVVTNPTPCSPCMRRTCNVPGHPCMRDLSADAVFESVRGLLAREPEAALG